MAKYPPTIQRLIDEFSHLPTIGPKTAERFVMHLLNRPDDAGRLIDAITLLRQQVTRCVTCNTFSEKSPCYICSNSQRQADLLCVVATTADLAAIESTDAYHGRYYVLGGTLEPLGDQTASISFDGLVRHVTAGSIGEIILAFDPTIEGEATALAIVQALKPLNIKISRLARGLPMGSQLIYADEVTISNAFEGRKTIS